jgi:hypothetical protein
VAGQDELEPEPESVQRRVARADEGHALRRRPQAPQIVVVLGRLQGEVVAEPFGLLVGVRVAADVDEESGVVDDRPLLVVEPDRVGQSQRDQALAKDVLHRLPEAQVYPEREGGHQLRQPNVRTIDLAGHWTTSASRGASARPPARPATGSS